MELAQAAHPDQILYLVPLLLLAAVVVDKEQPREPMELMVVQVVVAVLDKPQLRRVAAPEELAIVRLYLHLKAVTVEMARCMQHLVQMLAVGVAVHQQLVQMQIAQLEALMVVMELHRPFLAHL